MIQHSDTSISNEYVRQAKKWYKRISFDWINALLKFHKKTYKKYFLEQQKGIEKPKLNYICQTVKAKKGTISNCFSC